MSDEFQVDPSDGSNTVADSGAKPWIRPQIQRMRAGAAESTPGSAIFDGALETIGS